MAAAYVASSSLPPPTPAAVAPIKRHSRKHAKMPPAALARYDVFVSEPGDPCLEQLKHIELLARRHSGAKRDFGRIAMATLQDLFFAHLRPLNRPLNPHSERDIRIVLGAIAFWKDRIGALEERGDGLYIRDFVLGSKATGFLTEADRTAELRARKNRKRAAKRRSRQRDFAGPPKTSSDITAIPGDLRNVASYLPDPLAENGSVGYAFSRAASAPRLQRRTSVLDGAKAAEETSPAGRCTDIETTRLLAQRQSQLNRKRLASRHADNLSLEQTLSAHPPTRLQREADSACPDRSAAAVAAPADAPKGASDASLMQPSPFIKETEPTNTPCTGPADGLEARLKRLAVQPVDDEIAAENDPQMAAYLHEPDSSARLTAQVHAEDCRDTGLSTKATPQHAGMPTVPLAAGPPLTPAFMRAFYRDYPEFKALRPGPLVRDHITQTHLLQAAASARRSKAPHKKPGLVVNGARMLRDGLWGVPIARLGIVGPILLR